jgi:hypothetical protein
MSMDRSDVPFLDGPQMHAFRTDPFRTFIRCDDETREKLWAVVESRKQPERPAIIAPGIVRHVGGA